MTDQNETQTTVEKEPKKESEAVKLWHERVSIARRSLEDWARESGANRFIDEYNGKFEIFFNGLKGKIPVPPINEIYAYVDADVSITYNRDPYISFNPKAGTVKGAKLWEAIVNYNWRELKTKSKVEPQIIDKDLVGFAWHKVGREVETEGAEEDLKITKDSLYSDRVDWKDVVFNLGSKDAPYDCIWMAQRIVKPLKFIKKKYKNAKNLKGVQNPEVDKNAYDNAVYKDDLSVGIVWEIWDRENREILLIAEGLNDRWLEEPRPWPEYMDEFPFLMYWDLYAPGKRFPMSAIAPWEAQVLEKMVLLAAAVNHSKRWNRQALIRKGAIDKNDLDKFERGDDGAIIDYTGTGALSENLTMIDWGTVPVDYYLLMDRLSGIQRDVNGQPEFIRGGLTKTNTRTDGELDKIAAGAKGRSDRKLDRFETHLENIARHMYMHLKGNFDFQEAVRITGWAPEELIEALGDNYNPITGVVTFTPEEIEGEYDAEIKAGSTLPLNREVKTQLLQGIIQTLGNVEGDATSPLLRTLLSELFDEFDMKSLKLAFAEEQALSAQQKQLEQQEVSADESKAKSQAVKNIAQAGKIETETAVMKIQATQPQEVAVPA